MAVRLLVLVLAIAATLFSGAVWQVWTTRNAVFLTPDAESVCSVPAGRGVWLMGYRANVGWQTAVSQRLEERGWSASPPVTPAPQQTYYRLTYLWIGYLSETVVLHGDATQAEMVVQRGFVWRSWSTMPLLMPSQRGAGRAGGACG